MKKLLVSMFIFLSVNAFCAEPESSFHTMVSDCKEFAIVNVLPSWKYYDSGVNAYMTLSPISKLPLVHLDYQTSRSFEEDYNVEFSGKNMVVTMSRAGSVVTLFVETSKLREGSYKSTAVVGSLENNFKGMFGQFENTVFNCESKITKD
ncbi:hypothetical protein K2X05_14750 [bacterium]|nr:hypothetical protein [bacterium]